MKRTSYIDKSGNPVSETFESKKIFLNIFLVIGTIVPIVLLGFIVYTIVENNGCSKIYSSIKTATLDYIKDNDQMPAYDGESETISIDRLYSDEYLRRISTNNLKCSGEVKVTKYKGKLVYTIDVKGCGVCSTKTRYGAWSKETSTFPSGKGIVDVVPYYNYYEREVSATDWSGEFLDEELQDEESEYGVRLPLEEYEQRMPEVPTEGNIVDIQASESYQYHYKDKQWLWYDAPKDYSEFSSEQPAGYTNKDEATKQYTEWTEYSLNHPEEKDYREITQVTGMKYYYLDNGKKVYANNGKYTAPDDVDRKKYNRYDEDKSPLYRYRDAQWRWYNGERRRYSSYSSTQPARYPYRDDETVRETNYTSWSNSSSINASNESYRTEERRTLTKLRYVYEILSLPVLKKPLNKEKFTDEIDMTVPEFAELEEYKLDITYKFIYRKR